MSGINKVVLACKKQDVPERTFNGKTYPAATSHMLTCTDGSIVWATEPVAGAMVINVQQRKKGDVIKRDGKPDITVMTDGFNYVGVVGDIQTVNNLKAVGEAVKEAGLAI